MIPGEYFLEASDVEANRGRPTLMLAVRHTGDRPVQVGSHYHFAEVNKALVFDRDAAWGTHLNIPSGTAVRFEPGDEKEVEVVPLAGNRMVFGHQGRVNGALP